jgi:uncharacterized membrane protein
MFIPQIIGTVSPPPFMKDSYSDFKSGITAFVSNMLKLLTIVAGLWALINFVLAGLAFISAAGDQKIIENAWKQIYMSLVGLVVIVLAYALTALISFLLFGDPSIILHPKIYGPGIN